jgi:conjugal transfer ATP-binding protein TraC
MTNLRRFTGSRANALFPTLAYDPDSHLFLLDDQSLAFGYLCEPLSAADQSNADRLLVLGNLDWPPETLLQVALWTSPDVEETVARMEGLRIETATALLRESTRRTAAYLRAGSSAPISPASDLRLRELQVLVTAKLPLAAPQPSAHELREARELQATALQVLATAGMRPTSLTADRHVRIMTTLLNWGPQAGWHDRITPECDARRPVRDQYPPRKRSTRSPGARRTSDATRTRCSSRPRPPPPSRPAKRTPPSSDCMRPSTATR